MVATKYLQERPAKIGCPMSRKGDVSFAKRDLQEIGLSISPYLQVAFAENHVFVESDLQTQDIP